MSRDRHENAGDWPTDRALTRRAFVIGLGGVAAGIAAGRLSPIAAAGAGRDRKADRISGEVPLAWFDLSLRLVRSASGFSPPVASRAFAYAGLTLYEAVVPGMPGYRSLGRLFPGLGGVPDDRGESYDWEAAANAALAAIFRSLIPTAGAAELEALDALEATFDRRFSRDLSHRVRSRSRQRGRDVADALFAWSQGDGGHEGYLRNFPPYVPPVGPGLWVPTPPGFLSALQPSWGSNRTFAIADGTAFPPGDHPPYSEEQGPGSGVRRWRSTTR